ncbi:MAG: hypothetical protein AB2L12_11225 [Smithellaceae bacterium]
MHQKTIAKQIIGFNKATFDNTFNAITILQDHSEKMIRLFLEKANLFPPEGKKMITEWMEAYKKGKKDFKESVDDSFKNIEHFFVDSAEEAGSPIYALMKKADQSVKGVNDKIEKESMENIDKSMQTIAIVADKTLKQNMIAQKETIAKVKSGPDSAKAERKTARRVKK